MMESVRSKSKLEFTSEYHLFTFWLLSSSVVFPFEIWDSYLYISPVIVLNLLPLRSDLDYLT
jgi:hypothetical protein